MERPAAGQRTGQEENTQRRVLAALFFGGAMSLSAWYATGAAHFAAASAAAATLAVYCVFLWCLSRNVQLYGGPLDGARIRVAPAGRRPGAYLDVLTAEGERVRYGTDTAGRLVFRGGA